MFVLSVGLEVARCLVSVLSLYFPMPSPVVLGAGKGSRYSGSTWEMPVGVGCGGCPAEGGYSPVSCLPFGFPLSWLDGGETNAVAKGFCCGNAAVGVSHTAGSLAQSCNAEPGVGQRQIGHRQTKPADVQKCPNIAEKHPENNRNLHLCCFINRQRFFPPSYNGDIS